MTTRIIQEQQSFESSHDHLYFNRNEAIFKILTPDEKIKFSCKAQKYNRFQIKQARNLMMTTDQFFILKGQTLNRGISLVNIEAMTKKTQESKTSFIVHVKDSHDYKFTCTMRGDLFKMVKECYFKVMKKNLPIFGVPEGLKNFVHSKKDISNGKQKSLPDQKYRLFDEDIYSETEEQEARQAVKRHGTLDRKIEMLERQLQAQTEEIEKLERAEVDRKTLEVRARQDMSLASCPSFESDDEESMIVIPKTEERKRQSEVSRATEPTKRTVIVYQEASFATVLSGRNDTIAPSEADETHHVMQNADIIDESILLGEAELEEQEDEKNQEENAAADFPDFDNLETFIEESQILLDSESEEGADDQDNQYSETRCREEIKALHTHVEDTLLNDEKIEEKVKRLSEEMMLMDTGNFPDETQDSFQVKQDDFWADIIAQQPYRDTMITETN